MSLILSGDSAVYYEEYGAGEPLILLPDLLGTIERHWRRFIPTFAQHLHTVAVDLRGHGRTNNPSGVLSLKAMADDLGILIDTLQLHGVRICGYGLGGYLGLYYGVYHPGAVDRLVMHATKFYWSTATHVQSAAAFPFTESGGALEQDHAPANGPEGWKKLTAASRELVQEMAAGPVTEDALALASFPVLVTVGDQDDLIPVTEAERLARSLPAGTCMSLPATRHPIQSLPTGTFLEAVLPFLRSPAGRR
jgi:pimeloyl-ACP methyl ester carboxylesterase